MLNQTLGGEFVPIDVPANLTDSRDGSLLTPWKLWVVAITLVMFMILLKSSMYVRGWLLQMPTLYRDFVFGMCLLHGVIHCSRSGAIFASTRARWMIGISHVALVLAILFQYDFDDAGQYWTVTALLWPRERYLRTSWSYLGILNVLVFAPVVFSWFLFMRLPRLRD